MKGPVVDELRCKQKYDDGSWICETGYDKYYNIHRVDVDSQLDGMSMPRRDRIEVSGESMTCKETEHNRLKCRQT